MNFCFHDSFIIKKFQSIKKLNFILHTNDLGLSEDRAEESLKQMEKAAGKSSTETSGMSYKIQDKRLKHISSW